MFPQNPYVAGNPVGDSTAFVGRADVLREVLRVLRHAKLRKNKLAELYQRALGALEKDDRETAQTLLAQVVVLEPTYEEATRYLHFAVTGTDVTKMMPLYAEELTECRQHEKDLEKAVSQYQQQVASLKNELGAKKKAEKDLKRLLENERKARTKKGVEHNLRLELAQSKIEIEQLKSDNSYLKEKLELKR
ncbi:hypothetical protein PN36_00115 [Candidatus Thiomargarita nelsonii]|uniref:Uncharacterized protein n=1 Tax=Candidatus Thiomargarita nelsonii TaxID=1003181 RepID=A0A4E0RUG8_9GAMM|nr:hypothetical protein PN36_00115 [Candidatus Thiomargarita nelsonii]